MTDDKLIDLWSEDDLDRALGALHDDVPTDQDRLQTSRATFLATIDRPVRRKRWAYVLTAAAAVTTLVVGGFLVTTNSPGGSAEAKAELNSAADHVIAKDPVIPPGKYRYRVSRAWLSGYTETAPNEGVTYLEEQLIETWIPADRTQEWMQRSSSPGKRKLIQGTQKDLDAIDKMMEANGPGEVLRAKCGDFSLDPGQQPCTRAGGWQDPTPEWVAGLPTDPKALYKRLKKDAPRNGRGETELLVYAADALRTGQVPAAVRSALYRALGNLDHLEVSDRAVNLDGKVGIAYGSDDGEERQEIIIDPRTGDYIGERQIVTSGKNRGQLNSFSSVTTSIVDRIGERPHR